MDMLEKILLVVLSNWAMAYSAEMASKFTPYQTGFSRHV